MRLRIAALFLAISPNLFAQQAKPIDVATSKMTVHASKSGVFSFAGHDHTISAPILSGSVDEAKHSVEFAVNAKDLRVLDPGESEKNRAEIQTTMLSDKLLDVGRFPTITFRSTKVEQAGPETFAVTGDLSLHGQIRSIKLNVKKSGNTYVGETKLKQTEFGMTPVTVAGGTIKVKDEVKVDFSIATRP
jgi:polyisoprenoid-binding protein YceI